MVLPPDQLAPQLIAGVALDELPLASRSLSALAAAEDGLCERWSDELGGRAQLEGGDILVIGNRCVLIGMGERARPAAPVG